MEFKHLKAYDILDLYSEVTCAFHDSVRASDFPHLHNFHEITLVESGSLLVTVNDRSLILRENQIHFLRPSDIHSRYALGECRYVNMNFSVDSMDQLNNYLGLEEVDAALHAEQHMPAVQLSPENAAMLRDKIASLDLIPESHQKFKKLFLRTLLLDTLLLYFSQNIQEVGNAVPAAPPAWMTRITTGLQEPQNLQAGMDYIYGVCEKTPEHICRSFHRFYHCTPSQYINSLRLERAVQLIAETPMPLNQVAEACGFQNLSLFFRRFKAAYGITPNSLRQEMARYDFTNSISKTNK
ncbi:MAG: AraC family transcriptional regulator [Eubacteriales bacterium]|jgi:AraC-like DNA-binding protein